MQRNGIASLVVTVAILALSVVPVSAQAIISNGHIQMGINPEGNLGVLGGPPSSGSGTTIVGLRSGNAEAITSGCDCEGWGAATSTRSTSPSRTSAARRRRARSCIAA